MIRIIEVYLFDLFKLCDKSLSLYFVHFDYYTFEVFAVSPTEEKFKDEHALIDSHHSVTG
jgi:hypothetical protein